VDTPAEQAHFENLFPNDDISRHPRIIAPSSLLKQRGAKWYDYVVLADGTLVIAERLPNIGHANLAEGAKVDAAGQVQVVGGRTVEIDNGSGHYLPKGKNARQAALAAFRHAGFAVSDEAYVEKFFDENMKQWKRRE
jgi:hypothetical protein